MDGTNHFPFLEFIWVFRGLHEILQILRKPSLIFFLEYTSEAGRDRGPLLAHFNILLRVMHFSSVLVAQCS